MAKIKVNLASLGPVKKHAAPIACGVVAAAAVVGSFYPLANYKKDLQAELDKSMQSKTAIDGLLNKQRQLPAVSADTTEAKPLEVFPTENVIKQGEAVVAQVTKQSAGLLTEIQQKNLHKLLVDDVLPAGQPSQKLTFRYKYQEFIDKTIPVDILNAGVPPAQSELQKALDDEKARITSPSGGVAIVGPNGQVLNPGQVQETLQKRMSQLPQEMRESVARSHKIYLGGTVNTASTTLSPVAAASRDALSVYPGILDAASGTSAIPEDTPVYFAQVGVWIQQDVAQAIAEINADAKSVVDAPVKHLLKINWPGTFMLPGQPGAVVSAIDPSAQIQPMKGYSPSGRVCCPLYDVVQFDLKLRVASKDLPNVLEGLGRNRLITVLKVNDVAAYDTAAAAAAGYFYGQDPVVEVTLTCEELFLRTWDYKYMPPLIKKGYFGIPLDQPAPTAAPAAAASAG